MDSIDPNDFRTFTRLEAMTTMRGIDDGDYGHMTNEELEAELCLSGYIHDEYMKGVYDSRIESEAGLHNAKLDYNKELEPECVADDE